MSVDQHCPNCNQPLFGQFCSNCGQNQKGSDRYFWTLVNEAFEGLFSLNSKAWRTTIALLFRPGFLTREHFAHRRARYVSPLRLYLITSIGFFLLLSLVNLFSPELNVVTYDQETDVVANTTDANEQADLNYALTELTTFNVQFPLLSDEQRGKLNAALSEKFRSAVELGKQRPRKVIAKLIDTAPPVIFALLPIFALVLKLLYLRSKRFYTQHLVLALHNHSFLFAVMTGMTLSAMFFSPSIDSRVSGMMSIWMVMYLVLSLKAAYEQGWAMTLFKSVLLFGVFFGLLVAAFVLVTLLGIILL